MVTSSTLVNIIIVLELLTEDIMIATNVLIGGGANPLAAAPVYNIADGNWHNVDIQILDNQIIVRWDGNVVLTYTDVYGRNLSSLNFGFGSRTGGRITNITSKDYL